jgi:hypothetical protein
MPDRGLQNYWASTLDLLLLIENNRYQSMESIFIVLK